MNPDRSWFKTCIIIPSFADFVPQFVPQFPEIIAKLYLHGICSYNIVQTYVPMQDIKTMKTEALIDRLVQLTAEYTDKMTRMNSVELSQYEYDIALIQGEINSRIKKVIPQSESQRLFNKIKSVLPLWRRYLVSSRNRPKPGFT
jgi:hypothetical protein